MGLCAMGLLKGLVELLLIICCQFILAPFYYQIKLVGRLSVFKTLSDVRSFDEQR